MADSTFIKRVRLRNYRSIASCDVQLGPLNFLVGPNGSGKSNFLDALRFVSDCLNDTLNQAISKRGGLYEMQWRSSELVNPPDIHIEIEFAMPDGSEGRYALCIGLGGPLQSEVLGLTRPGFPEISYEVRRGQVLHSSINPPPAAQPDRLYLINASGVPELRPVYDALIRMRFYNVNPDHIRVPGQQTAPQMLLPDGANLASVLHEIEQLDIGTKQRIEEYLGAVVPGISEVAIEMDVHKRPALDFRQYASDGEHRLRFPANNMSDGTLRALGNLVALFQFANGERIRPSLIGIEEPETALHPAAAGVLRDSFREASRSTQVLVTSHSSDLLDDPSIPEGQIIAVATKDGATRIGVIDAASRSVLRDRLFTIGELLRLDQLQPEPGCDRVEA
jgi:predicted ATPase